MHEKLAIIVSFAYSQKPLANMRHRKGEWKFLEKIVNDIPRQAATQAVVEFALYFRTLDGEQRVTDYWRRAEKPPTFGMLYMKEGDKERLSAREMSNKVIHADVAGHRQWNTLLWRLKPAPGR
jgi:hypothetical protein